MEKEYNKRIKYLSERSRFCLTSRIQLLQLKQEFQKQYKLNTTTNR